MPPRSSWKGFLKLSLVSVPVKAYTATAAGAEIHLNQLHAECNNRIKYAKTCPEHGEVAKDEIVSGYEFAKGQYVVIDLGELEKLRTESDKSVQIDGFIADDEVDAIYFTGKTHYLVPDGPVGQKPYALLLDGMRKGGLHAIGQVVMSGKEQVVLIRPHGELITMSTLSWDARVKKTSSFTDEVSEPQLTKEEIALTKTLMDASTIKDFDYSSYTDTYTQKLTQLIDSKVEGKEIVEVPDAEEAPIINLMEALKQSVARAQATTAPKKKAAGKKAPRKKATGKMAPSAKKTAKKKARKSG